MNKSDKTDNNVGEEIRQSPEILSTIFDLNPDAIVLTTVPDSKIIDCNQEYLNQVGYSKEEVIGHTAIELNIINPRDRNTYMEKIHDVNSISNFELKIKRKNGDYIDVLYSARYITVNDKQLLLNIGKDITNQKNVDRHLQEMLDKKQKITEELQVSNEELKTSGEELLRLNQHINDILDSIQDNLYVIDSDWNYVYVNKQAAAVLGMKPNDFIGKNLWKLFPKYKGTIDGENFINAMNNGKISRFETYSKYTGIWYMVTVYPSSEGITILGTDITESKKVEKKLAEQALMLANINDAVIGTDINYIINYWNKPAEKMYGYSKEEIIGQYSGILKPEFLGLTSEEAITQLETTGNLNVELIHTTKDGRKIFIDSNNHILCDDSGNRYGIIGINRDITERKNAEEEIKVSLNEKEVLIREIHHRVKNNLQIIASLLHLQERCVEGEEFVNMLKESETRVKSMAIIHEKLYQSPTLANINFKEYIENLVYDILYTYGVQEGFIKTNMDIEDINLNIDTAIPLGLIINEIITNSVKYAFPESKGVITIELKSINEEMELIVSDNGKGLPNDINLENAETLGLQLVNNLTNQIDGHIYIDRSNGTTFKIIFKEIKYKKRT